ncbi:MAG: hypothetical protein K2W85_02755 [Phycisphaerales bacterium]|nr:hypothetical protein [Phycisphaerales bacterium]
MRLAFRIFVLLCATASSMFVGTAARAQMTSVSLEASSFTTAQITLGGFTSQSEIVNVTGTLDVAAPASGAGDVLLRNVRISIPQVVLAIPFPVTVGAAQLESSVNQVATLSGSASGTFETLFFGPGPTGNLTGQVSYSGTGPTCLSLAQLGGPCAGTFALASVGERPTMIGQGVITPSPGARSVQMVFTISTPLVAGGQAWSRLVFDVAVRATLPAQAACIADFTAPSGIDVQDLFAFLNAWFTGDTRSDINGGGITVTDIFDYLNAWFQGCP